MQRPRRLFALGFPALTPTTARECNSALSLVDHILGQLRPYAYTSGMERLRKVTANIPQDILEHAQRLTGKGITLTLVEGLRALDRNARRSALRQLRGKVGFELDLQRTRR